MENVILSSYTLEQLQAVVRACIKDELKTVSNPPPSDELLNSKEAARFLKVSLVTLHKWKLSGKIKFHRIGSRIRFRKSELESALHSINCKKTTRRK